MRRSVGHAGSAADKRGRACHSHRAGRGRSSGARCLHVSCTGDAKRLSRLSSGDEMSCRLSASRSRRDRTRPGQRLRTVRRLDGVLQDVREPPAPEPSNISRRQCARSAGISIETIVWAALIPTHWRRGCRTSLDRRSLPRYTPGPPRTCRCGGRERVQAHEHAVIVFWATTSSCCRPVSCASSSRRGWSRSSGSQGGELRARSPARTGRHG